MWKDHIEGKDANGKLLPALGVIPINEEQQCKWGCIDVDVYNVDHKQLLMRNIKGLSFPLVTFRSKSGGAHLFLFAERFIPASLMQKIKTMATALGYEGSEVFPKQTELLAERGDVGNFLNLPYHAGCKRFEVCIR